MVLPFNAGNTLIVTTSRGEIPTTDVKVQTRFAAFQCGMKKAISDGEEMWYKLRTRPAFEIALLRKGDDGKPEIVVMRKQRLITDVPREKLPGGYYDDSADRDAFRVTKVLRDCGIKMKNVMPAGSLLGHGEIVLPIEFFCSTDWQSETSPRKGVEVGIIPLSWAVDRAMEGRIENDSSFSLIMRVDYLLRKKVIEL